MNRIISERDSNEIYKNEKIPPSMHDRHPRITSQLQPNLFETLHILQSSNRIYLNKQSGNPLFQHPFKGRHNQQN